MRLQIPYHLRNLIGQHDMLVWMPPVPQTIGQILDRLEADHPVLKGTLRDHGQTRRRPLIRFFVLEEDWSNEPLDRPLPAEILSGEVPFLIVGAIAGG
jgi:sulfur-carrier protein